MAFLFFIFRKDNIQPSPTFIQLDKKTFLLYNILYNKEGVSNDIPTIYRKV